MSSRPRERLCLQNRGESVSAKDPPAKLSPLATSPPLKHFVAETARLRKRSRAARDPSFASTRRAKVGATSCIKGALWAD